MTDNAWYFWGITIVLLDSFQICVNNNFVLEVIHRDSGTTVVGSPDLAGQNNLVEGLRMTGEIVSGFMCLIM